MFSEACKPNSATLFKEKEIKFTTENMLNDRAVKAPLLSVQIIDTLIYNLKMGKSASVDSLTAEHLKYAHPCLIIILTKLFNMMLALEYVPNAFASSKAIPIPKIAMW